MSGFEAACQTDEIGHSLGLLGMVSGYILGAVAGAALVAATVATGGGAMVVVMSVAAAGMATAGGGLALGQLVHGIETATGWIPTTGELATGSPNVFIGRLPASRAVDDVAAGCHGLYWFNHFSQSNVRIAEGAKTVLINRRNIARVSMRLQCGAAIKHGEPTVLIGGPTAQVLPVASLEDEFRNFLASLFEASLVTFAGLTLLEGGWIALLDLGIEVGGAVLAFEVLGEIGDALGPGWRDILQGAFGVGLMAGGLAKLGKLGQRPKVDPVKTRISELSNEGHGPQRHEGQLTDQQLHDRAMNGIDPMSGTTTDAVSGKPHQCGKHATRVNTPEDYVSAEDSLRHSSEFQTETAEAEANAGAPGADRVAVRQKLEDIYGPDYRNKVAGKTRTGSAKNPTGTVDTDFTDGTMKGVYERDPITGQWHLLTMYPEPK